MRHRHTKKCRHSAKKSGGRKHHHHTKRCRHTKRNNSMMKGGISSYPSSYSLGVNHPVSNFDFNASSYGSSTIPTSISGASMSTASMLGGRRRRRHSRRHSRRQHRGGMGYSFLPPGSELNAKDSYLANLAPYSVYNE